MASACIRISALVVVATVVTNDAESTDATHGESYAARTFGAGSILSTGCLTTIAEVAWSRPGPTMTDGLFGMDQETQGRADAAFEQQADPTLVGRAYTRARVWFMAGFKIASDQALKAGANEEEVARGQ